MKTMLIWIGVGSAALVFAYCVLGVITVSWISATPGDHDLTALKAKAYGWIAGSVISFLIGAYLLYVALRKN